MLTGTRDCRPDRVPQMVALCVGAIVLVGCGASESIDVTNEGDSAVTVAFADETPSEVLPGGCVAVLTDDCIAGPTVVTFASGRVVELAEPACPGQNLLIVEDGSAEWVPQEDGTGS